MGKILAVPWNPLERSLTLKIPYSNAPRRPTDVSRVYSAPIPTPVGTQSKNAIIERFVRKATWPSVQSRRELPGTAGKGRNFIILHIKGFLS